MNFDMSSAIIAGVIVLVGIVITSIIVNKSTKVSYIVGIPAAFLSVFLILPLVFHVGTNMSRSDITSYKEFWNGLEKSADVQKTVCTEDGNCHHTYDCDPYEETYIDYETTTDSKGNTTTTPVVKTRTEYHSCPYVDAEYTYTVKDTLGETYTMGDHWFPADPNSHRWRSDTSVPGSVPSGIPSLWQAAKDRIDSGNPGGTTQIHTYDNWVLASQMDIYHKHSSDMDDYIKAGLMPKIATNVSDYYISNKVYQAGTNVSNIGDWNTALERFNGYFGTKQGDLHIVLVDSSKVTDPDKYNGALEAYWQDTKLLGKNTMSKNGIGLSLGIDPTTGVLKWVRAFTGMPTGNEKLVVDLQNLGYDKTLTSTALMPNVFLDHTNNGLLYKTLMSEYNRVHMADYKYLKDSIPATDSANVWMIVLTVLFSGIVTAGILAVAFSMVNDTDANDMQGLVKLVSNGKNTVRSVNDDLLDSRTRIRKSSRYDTFDDYNVTYHKAKSQVHSTTKRSKKYDFDDDDFRF